MGLQEYQREWKRRKRLNPAFRLKAASIQRKYYKNNVEYKLKHRAYRLKTRYGLTLEQYQELLDRQNGCCALCKKHHSEFKNNLVVDHDHKSLEIRSLLCTHCNLWIVGKLRKDTIQSIYDYLMGKYTGLFTPKHKPKKRKKKLGKSRGVVQ